MKVVVCGDRNWSDENMVYIWLSKILDDATPPHTFIHGDARGADSIGAHVARQLACNVMAFPAEWDVFGLGAGPIRNRKMLAEKPDLVLAFHDSIDDSLGTKDILNVARKTGIKTILVSHGSAGSMT